MNKELIAFLLSAMALFAGSVQLFASPKLESTTASSGAIPVEVLEAFAAWKVQYGKFYNSNDYEEYRMAVFYRNYEMIKSHNARKGETYSMASNQFMDLTSEEFVATYLTLNEENKPTDVQEMIVDEDFTAPNAIDWSSKVTSVKNQGSCGSCWAFSATATLESHALITGKGNHNFSEQQLVDCSRSYGNQGCNGGWPSSAINYIKDHGIVEQASYPYAARDQACKTNSGPYKSSGPVAVPAGNCNALTQALSGRPLSVCVDATNWSFYSGGVFRNCGANINHAVLLTGQDNAGNWRIKNSWGTGWGTTGYITLAPGNTCAVCNVGVYVN